MGTRNFLSAWIVGGGIWATGLIALFVVGVAIA